MGKVLRCNPTVMSNQIDWLIARNITIDRLKVGATDEERLLKLLLSGAMQRL